MKRTQLSGAKKRKIAQSIRDKTESEAKVNKKVTEFFVKKIEQPVQDINCSAPSEIDDSNICDSTATDNAVDLKVETNQIDDGFEKKSHV